ncbi:MAG: putative glycoside hydrolase [Candidatus Thermoplasmatota archaeon]
MYKGIKKPDIFTLLILIVVTSLLLSGCVQNTDKKTSDKSPVSSSTFLNISPPPETEDIREGTPYGWKVNYTLIFFNDFESSNPELGLDLTNGAELVSDAIDGEKSVRIENYQNIQTNPEQLPLSPNNYYVIEYDYRILKRGSSLTAIGGVEISNFIYPEGSNNDEESIHLIPMLSNAVQEGSFSTGGLTTNTSDAYYFKIVAMPNSSIIIDNIRIYRVDQVPVTNPPDKWDELNDLPYPRLGSYGGHSLYWATDAGGVAPSLPKNKHVYQVEELEKRLAFFDVVVGPIIDAQTYDTSFVKRLQEKNPGMVVLPYRVTYEQDSGVSRPPHSTVSAYFQFFDGLSEEWVVTDTSGSKVLDSSYSAMWKMDFSDNCTVVNGQNYTDYLIDYLTNIVAASGVWDGIFLDNLDAKINTHIKNHDKPSLFDYDINRNGKRDETPAKVSEMTRPATIELLQRLRKIFGNNELIIGNNGWNPELCLASYINGYVFESWNTPWYASNLLQPNEGLWKRSLNDYFEAEENTRAPHLNILEATGHEGEIVMGDEELNRDYLEPTEKDIKRHRFAMGTALLNDGFYEYDLYDMRSPPYLFDEYSVNDEGVAVEDREYKGYLGMPLSDAVELKSNSTLIWEESFDSGSLPSSLQGDGMVENQKLVMHNPDHTETALMQVTTKSDAIPFEPEKTYLIEFDWEILETLDYRFTASLTVDEGILGTYYIPEVIEGESGSIRFPVTLNYGNDFTLNFLLNNGGKVAIDNINVYEGGAGPWRRDFENGFVLVNPLNTPYTFNSSELSGELDRTGIKRILGTQAPDINNGEPVTDSLSLQPFDAIILLADHKSKS